MTVNSFNRYKFGNGYLSVIDFTLSSSYSTDGESLVAGDFGLTVLDAVIPAPAGGYVFEYDHDNQKLKVYYADYDATGDGALVEVGSGVDLSSVTSKAVAIGR